MYVTFTCMTYVFVYVTEITIEFMEWAHIIIQFSNRPISCAFLINPYMWWKSSSFQKIHHIIHRTSSKERERKKNLIPTYSFPRQSHRWTTTNANFTWRQHASCKSYRTIKITQKKKMQKLTCHIKPHSTNHERLCSELRHAVCNIPCYTS